MKQIPYILGTGRNATLFVDEKPFHIKGGELHNSSASCLDYMEQRVWPALKPLNLNTVIAPVYWECLEPEEGVFAYSLVDGLIKQARENGVRLVLLWFGLWKNSSSWYIPTWVKEQRERFWYVKAEDGDVPKYFYSPNLVISPLCNEAVMADANAFSHLMAHIKEIDEERTVIAVQVENEIGVLGSDRDYSLAANAAYAQNIPEELQKALGKKEVSWEEAFGEEGPQYFMAWYYSQAVNTIAGAGKKEYPLPMYANCWLEQAPSYPGKYPSGGPISRNFPIWEVGAPNINLFAPDIYVKDFAGTLKMYATEKNPLFIPETRLDTAAYLYALGKYNAMCFSPFGIEDTFDAQAGEVDDMTLRLLNISKEAFAKMKDIATELGKAYALTEEMDELITESHAKGRSYGFISANGQGEENSAKTETINMENVEAIVSYQEEEFPAGGGMIIEIDDYEFLVMAINCTIQFRAKNGKNMDTLVKEEGKFQNGEWKRGRILNGDERYFNVFRNQVELIRFKFLPY